MSELLEPDLVWTGAEFEEGLRIAVDAAGRIEAVRLAEELPGDARRLARRAVLPGLVNAHSHAFQRGLRGLGERFPGGAGSFWTWRAAMYGLVEVMDGQRMQQLSSQAFREMLAAGITSVGEFHYLHHDGEGPGWELDQAVLAAAEETGIRIVLLQAYYATGSIGKPLEGAQLRFRSQDPADYWSAFDRLDQAQALGCVVHSIRAADLGALREMHAESVRRGLVFHMHLEEQHQEIDECRAAYGRTPMGVLLEELSIDERFTAIHCTHTQSEELRSFLDAGGNVCLCPLTEANLGDGLPDLGAWSRTSGGAPQVALGTDSNARIAMVEEMRWMEYAQRLDGEERGVLRDPDPEAGRVAPVVFEAATRGGARSLGLEAGVLEPGACADLMTLDLAHASLAGWERETLLESWIFGAGNAAVGEVCVGGRWLD